MIQIKGIHLRSKENNTEELHKFARMIILGKSWYNMEPYPHYVLICPHKYKRAIDTLDKEERKKDKINLEIKEIFTIFTS